MKRRALACILSLLFLLCTLSSCVSRADRLFITVLDVGQGDSILVSVEGKHLLIDTGSGGSRDALLGELDRLGVKDLEAILITHPHEDHYGNARMLLETRTVGTLFLPQAVGEEPGYGIMLDAAARCKVKTKTLFHGDTVPFNGAVCEIFSPLPGDPEPNNAGLVVRIRYGLCRLLFMGDTELAGETALLAQEADWKCDFLKVGHHGSKTACSESFLQASRPRIAAISCALDNDYGFPHAEVLEGLDAIGADVYRTDLLGTLRFACDGKDVIFEK